MGSNNSKPLFGSSAETQAMFGSKVNKLGTKVRPSTLGAECSIEAVVDEIRFTEDRLSVVSVYLPNGSYLTNIMWPGGYIDPETNELHGDYIPPVQGQKVMVAFADGDIRNPFISGYIFRAALSDEASKYVDYKPNNGLESDSIVRSHRSGGKQHFSKDNIETGFKNGGDQKISKTKIESGIAADGVIGSAGKILQDANGIKLGVGGPTGHKPVAVVEENYVLTALGLQPILPAPNRTGPFDQVVKA